jgi:KinB signaling pathway activation protein
MTNESTTITTPLKWYLRLLAGLTMISGVAQLAFPVSVGMASAWGVAPGWQREIAFWDFAMYIVVARTLWANDANAARTITIALVALQLVVAANHSLAAVQTHAMLNTVMAVVNCGCVVFGLLAFRFGAAARTPYPGNAR